jgi:hypothetical protein
MIEQLINLKYNDLDSLENTIWPTFPTLHLSKKPKFKLRKTNF